MKKSIFVFTIIFIWISNFSTAQNIAKPIFLKQKVKKSNYSYSIKKCSPSTAILIKELNIRERKSLGLSHELEKKYLLQEINNQFYVNAFVKLNTDYDIKTLKNLGVKIYDNTTRITTAHIPVNKLKYIINLEEVEYVQIAKQVNLQLDSARTSTRTHLVHKGQQLSQSFFGNDVVVGIIDKGFDYTHPTFYDSTHTKFRIKKVWEQKSDGTTPSDFDYGKEISGDSNIITWANDIEFDGSNWVSRGSHGTHVTGIAAGSGAYTDGIYKGVAGESDIIIVSTTLFDVDIMDGISYIYNYAQSVGKPCVINMSIGHQIGPHDGTSMFDQYCDNIVGQGKILVGAAGNAGDENLHIKKSFTGNDTLIYSFVKFPNGDHETDGSTIIDIWGTPGTNFRVAVNIYNANSYLFEDWTPYIDANSNSVYFDTLYDDDTFFPDDCIVKIASESSNPNNSKPHIIIENLDNSSQDDDFRYAMIEIIAYSGTVDIWANSAEFSNNGYSYPVVSGNTNHTVGEIGGTGNSIITVGAYTSKNNYTDYSGINHNIDFYTSIGEIAPFSSIGPTVDGRTKPDIIAPGNVVVSSVNSYDSNYPSSSQNVVTRVTDGTNNWYFAQMQGTSMAAPMVTGIIALWLEANPNLTPSQIKQFIQNNAWTDSYTGSVPNYTWGWGKIDAHEGIKQILDNLPPKPGITITGETTFCQGDSVILSAPAGYSYSWSNGEEDQNINVAQQGSYSLKVIDSNGWESPSSDTIEVQVNPLPDKPDITASGATTFCDGDSVTLSAPSGFTYNWSNGISSREMKIDTAGSYSLTVTDENSCTSPVSDTFIITVNALPTIDLGNDTTITTDYIIFLDAGAGFTSYLWNNDSITQILEINGSEVGTGIYNYSVIVTDNNTCSNSDTIEITVETGSGIDNLSLKPLIKLYPNPTTGIINIVIEGYMEQNLTIEVLNITGGLVYSKQLENMKAQIMEKIDLSEQPKGIYIFKLHNHKIMHVRKVLIQ